MLAPLVGAALFDHADDPWAPVIPFVLVVLATSALTAELTAQAQRPGRGWTRSDKAIPMTLLLVAALLALSASFADTPDNQRTVAVCFAVLYVVLAGYFCHVRRKALRHT
ncbi:hypothetical protein Ade02nite_78800 [Paractinoplanes deccanensis]|uniref:Amino acid permease n=1 Tax=Paractinoplanes deccanensis TaxID=113561 RepID=A0ABQ3YGW2_9ACTN|nr:hypothetical protein Ade02nite_78800 [Actinoplanes deccanensis]